MKYLAITVCFIVQSVGSHFYQSDQLFAGSIQPSDLGDIVFFAPPPEGPNQRSPIHHVELSEDGSMGLVSSKTKTLIIDFRTNKPIWGMDGDVTPAGLSGDGKWAFVTARRGTRLFNALLQEGKGEGLLFWRLDNVNQGQHIPGIPSHAALDAEGRQLAIMKSNRVRPELELWDVRTGLQRNISYKVKLNQVDSIIFSDVGDDLHLNGTLNGAPMVQSFTTYRGVPNHVIPHVISVKRNGGYGHTWGEKPESRIIGMAGDQSIPSFLSVTWKQIAKVAHVHSLSPGYTDAPQSVAVTGEPAATVADFVTGYDPGQKGRKKKVAIGYSQGSIAIWNWKDGKRTDCLRPHKSTPTAMALCVPKPEQERMIIGYQDGSVLYIRNPKRLESIWDRFWAYREIQELLTAAGGKAQSVRFPTLASFVTGDFATIDVLDGFYPDWVKPWIDPFPFSPVSQTFLEEVNVQLYRVNALVFRKLLHNPKQLFDPTEWIIGLKEEHLGRAPRSGLEFDLQMVKFEQRQLEIIMKHTLPKSPKDRKTIFDDLTVSLYHEPGLVGWGVMAGGSALGFETNAVRYAYYALGERSPNFEREKERRLIGFAEVFIEHGGENKASFEAYLKYVRHGKLPPGF